jgi:hypothetical protein
MLEIHVQLNFTNLPGVTKMITLMTEDGYKFYLLEDGRIVDSLDEDTRDITFESFEEFVRLTQE